jgi:hypothetical protein
MRDASEQGGTSTYPPPASHVTPFLVPVLWTRVDNTPPVRAVQVQEVIEWLRQPVINYPISVGIQSTLVQTQA